MMLFVVIKTTIVIPAELIIIHMLFLMLLWYWCVSNKYRKKRNFLLGVFFFFSKNSNWNHRNSCGAHFSNAHFTSSTKFMHKMKTVFAYFQCVSLASFRISDLIPNAIGTGSSCTTTNIYINTVWIMFDLSDRTKHHKIYTYKWRDADEML